MLRWFLYDDAVGGDKEGDSNIQNEEVKEGGFKNRLDNTDGESSDSGSDMAPTQERLDPAVTAAILTQAAFRGYRLRRRLRRLPAREAERAIRGLQRNAHGFRRLGLFLAFFGLYFALVIGDIDVAFQRSVEQGLRKHVQMVKYGIQEDRGYEDVSSIAELHQWIQALFLKTYQGTQLEHRCTCCVLKPPDEVCDECDFSVYDASVSNPYYSHDSQTWLDSGSSGSSSSDGRDGVGHASSNSSSDRSSSSSSTTGGRSKASTADTPGSYGLSEQCGRCVMGRECAGLYEETCRAVLGLNSSSSVNMTTAEFLASPELAAVKLELSGGVSADGDTYLVANASECDNIQSRIGTTENLGRFNINLPVAYNGLGYIAERNRIIGGLLVTFSKRLKVPAEDCEASRDFYDVCVAEGHNKTTIVPGGDWIAFRPAVDIPFNEEASGFPVLVDTGGFNTGLNMGYCTLLKLEELQVIPPDEVRSVSVQLVTYNGNQKSAYGTIYVDFDFEDGGEITVKGEITAYVLDGHLGSRSARYTWLSALVFVAIYLGMVRHDTKRYCRVRRSKTLKRNYWHCCCGLSFHILIFLNILMWLGWAAVGNSITFLTDFQDTDDETPVLDSVTQEVVLLYQVALFAQAFYYIFLVTTLVGLYRWIFQMLTFHKRMSIVTDTLSRASTHLDHFCFVFLLVVLVFANMTWLLVGSSAKEFFTLEEAWRSVLRISLGEAENFYPQILAAQPTVGPVVIVLYQVLGIVLLLNVVIAIILEAYREVVGGMRGEDTIFQSLVAFIGMTLCLWRVKISWATSYVKWRLSRNRRMERRPSLKVALQGMTGVYGVDGRPVLMIRRPLQLLPAPLERQLSFNCPRYITVGEMHALIQAAPVPSFVADRLVRKIVQEWVFRSAETRTGESNGLLSSSMVFGNFRQSSSGDGSSVDSMPLLRRKGEHGSLGRVGSTLSM